MRPRSRRPVRGRGRGNAGVSDSDLLHRFRSGRGHGETNSQPVAPGRVLLRPARPSNSETPRELRRMMKVLNVVGARPNFMKMAPIIAEMNARGGEITQTLVHTGQHYDDAMSGAFFRDLGMPEPDVYLASGGGTHAEQTARVMLAFEGVVVANKTDWVGGDGKSGVACGRVAGKLRVCVARVEAGLRSGDWAMPEEINRVLTDRLSDLLLTPSPDADQNLLREGIAPDRIVRVGNVMIDT